MLILTQRKLRPLVLLQKKYLYTCKNIVTKPNLEEFLGKLFEQYQKVKFYRLSMQQLPLTRFIFIDRCYFFKFY